ncbi:MAG: hypothetical protein JNL98_03660 [Bryobacterales bacterium]|nr:hypothetical protein [Bryobacterales bacterium]
MIRLLFGTIFACVVLSAQSGNALHTAIAKYARSSAEAQLKARAANPAFASRIAAGTLPIGYAEVYSERATTFAALVLYHSATGKNIDTLAGGAIAAAISRRTDTQAEAQPAADGSTSLVTKGLAPKVLSWAVEHGALTRVVEQTNVTFRGNAGGIVRALAKESPVDILFPEKTWWNGLSMAVTFDTNRGSQPGTLLANAQQVTAWSVRSEVLNRRDPSASQYRLRWQNLGNSNFRLLADTDGRILASLSNWPLWKALMDQFAAELTKDVDAPSMAVVKANGSLDALHEKAAEIAGRYLSQMEALAFPQDPVLKSSFDDYYAALERAISQREDLKSWISQGVLLTADWSVKRDVNLPDLSTVTGVFEISPDKARKHELTVNGSVSFFNTKPQAAKYEQLRDTKVAIQYDVPFKLKGGSGAGFVLTLASRWEHIPDPTPLTTAAAMAMVDGSATGSQPATGATSPASMMMAAPMVPAGDVGVFQAKFTIPLGNTGLRLPFSLTASNRKGYIQEKWSIGANFGLTLNFDSLIPSLKK